MTFGFTVAAIIKRVDCEGDEVYDDLVNFSNFSHTGIWNSWLCHPKGLQVKMDNNMPSWHFRRFEGLGDTRLVCWPLLLMADTSPEGISIYNFTPDSPNELANEPNNVWKPGNCIWKVLIGSKMRSSTPGPLKRSRSNLWAQVLIRTSPRKLGLVTAFKSDCNGMECCIS